MEKNKKETISGWSDRVEDLVDNGDDEGAISLLESVISNLETLGSSSSSGDLRLASALGDLADLHSSRGFSIKADELRSRAILARARAVAPSGVGSRDPKREDEEIGASESSNDRQEEVDDWEAIADDGVTGGLLPSRQGETSSPPRVDPSPKEAPKRRGRGSFLYQKSYLYSDQPDVETTNGKNSAAEDEVEVHNRGLDDEDDQVWNLGYGTSHVLVLYDFSPSTRTTDLEKLFDDFRDRGFAIRWVNDTTALAVFRTPSLAQEAQSTINCPFKVRKLDDEDDILTQISRRDLEPPILRPKTSARTAQRLIAQGMGIKFSTDFGSNELRKQENARKSRIIARQTMKDDAWGSD
ncbi:uncharacterized protein A4U43_C02F7220 [Asparagus officinalis]|uniref:Coiled-coil domain-containing protein R3HCC1L n=1 Tax=Asparagus officinalis TaxID=4686 RepID=A0A5P1FLM7_ASPOF|nr:R3H and coiled-coil domain-containing protein 1 [Asparagus officinalis]ONK77500.1 uncharacterized protein A4U43_C02F7220 [Asparagus officinalis]